MEQQDHDDLMDYLESKSDEEGANSYSHLIKQLNEDIPF